ncbi:MAG: hypothetical protein IJ429_03125 [Lachnospiraceae bacterium]|nr:hypothetical protein [Lachnospiraceae bacterium]
MIDSKKKNPITGKNTKWIFGVSVGLLLFVMGFLTRQYDDIYRKAIMICLECIGIG